MIDQLFGSKTRVKLLYLFLNNPNRPFYVREITRKIEEQINSVRRELANLLSIGIITSISKNNKLFYEVNQKSEYYKPLREIFTSVGEDIPIAKEADMNERRFRELGSVHLAYFMGGLVQDSSTPVDIFIVGDINKAKLNKLVADLEEEEGQELNYTTMTKQEFDYRKDINDRFLADLLSAKKSAIIESKTQQEEKGE